MRTDLVHPETSQRGDSQAVGTVSDPWPLARTIRTISDIKWSNFLTALSLVLVWEVISRWVLPRMGPTLHIMLPPPSAVVMAGVEMYSRGELIAHILASLGRVLVAWGAAAALAIPVGILMGAVPVVGRQADHVVEALRPIPPMAWIPLSLVWFGIGDSQNRFIVFVGAFFPILLNTVHGVRRMEPVLIRAALCLGARRTKLMRKVVLPGALPSVFVGLRLGMGSSWASLVAAELVGATSGLGFLLQDSRFLFRTDKMLFSMVSIGVLGMLCSVAVERIQARAIRWDRSV